MEENESVEVVQRLASPQARLGAYLVDIGLGIVTLIIGWLIWSFFTWQTGQTPAKRLMKQVVVDAKTGEPFTWTRMLLREAAVKWAAGGIASTASNGITFVIDSLFVFRDDRKTVHDMIV
ncbi:MAG: RDD family protein, partial [Actinobacteria bacterium]|nr:RDD family protein [Actinomycetota bacterium]